MDLTNLDINEALNVAADAQRMVRDVPRKITSICPPFWGYVSFMAYLVYLTNSEQLEARR